MINNLLTLVCIFLLLVGGISTKHKNTECKRDHLISVKAHNIDCAHDNYACLECTDSIKSNISKTIVSRVSVNKKNVLKKKITDKYFLAINRFSNCQLAYTNFKPPGNLIIHRLLASVIILT